MLYTAGPEVFMTRAATSRLPVRQTTAELDIYPYVTEEGRAQVAQHLQGVSATYALTDDESAAEEEEAHNTHRNRGLKSCKICTTDSLAVKRVKGLREMVFTSQGQIPVYGEMSLACFINIYLAILAEETDTTKSHMLTHLQELMEDSEVY